MARFCSNCGNEVDENAIICVKCGCSLKVEENENLVTSNPKGSLILGSLGIVFALLFALIGHVLSIIGIIVGIKEYKKTNKMT